MFFYLKTIFHKNNMKFLNKYLLAHEQFKNIYDFIILNIFVNINSFIKISYLITGLEGERLQFINTNYSNFISNSYFIFSHKNYFYKKDYLFFMQ